MIQNYHVHSHISLQDQQQSRGKKIKYIKLTNVYN